MSFAFLSLAQFLALFGASAGVIVALYFMRRRKKAIVPSLLIWQRLQLKAHAGSFFRRFVWLFSLLAHLLFLLLLLLALAEPRPSAPGAGRLIALVIDASASMQVRLPAPSKETVLDRAKSRARDLANSLAPGDKMLVIKIADVPSVAAPLSSDRSLLERGISSITATDVPGNLAEALEAASALSAPDLLEGRKFEVVVISDGRFSPADRELLGLLVDGRRQVLPEGAAFYYLQMGARADNIGIGGRALEPSAGDPFSFDLSVEVRNFSASGEAARFELALYKESRKLESAWLELGPGERLVRTFTVPGEIGKPARCSIALNWPDSFEADNVAYFSLPPVGPIRVLSDSLGSGRLESALALYPGVKLARSRAILPGYDLYVINRAFGEASPPGHAVYLVSGKPLPLRRLKAIEKRSAHPLLRGLDLRDWNVTRAFELRLRDGDQVLLQAGEVPLVIAREDDSGRKRLIINFPLESSDLPRRADFPVLLANTLAWFGLAADPDSLNSRTGSVRLSSSLFSPGSEIEVAVRREAAPIVAIYDGERIRFRAEGSGFYEINSRGGPCFLAANLASGSESDLGEELQQASGMAAPLVTDRGGTELWVYLAVAALLLGALEWLAYHRGLTV